MKTIKSLKDITTLEVGDKVVFGDLEYTVTQGEYLKRYYLVLSYSFENDEIFNVLNTNKQDFIDKLGIKTAGGRFPETYSLEALTAVVSALFKEYEKQNELPKTWEEFCVKNKIKKGESYISLDSQIRELSGSERDSTTDRNVCISKQEAEAFLALNQLRQLRKAYVKDWEPNWNMPEIKYVIKVIGGHCFRIIEKDFEISPLSFPTAKLANQFLTNFKDLIEIAKPLL